MKIRKFYFPKTASCRTGQNGRNACSGLAVDVKKGRFITVIDIEGKQVVDFFAEACSDTEEFLSAGVTIDCNESLCLKTGDTIYTNRCQPMFRLAEDDVGEHDLLHPCCRKEMYDFFYGNGRDHHNCLYNINNSLKEHRPCITPVNLFMHTRIHTDGSISVEAPVSKHGDKVVLESLMDVCLGIAACSVSESECSGGRCTGIQVIIKD